MDGGGGSPVRRGEVRSGECRPVMFTKAFSQHFLGTDSGQ